MLITKETFDQILNDIKQSSIDVNIIRSSQLDTSTVKLILTHYKQLLVDQMKKNHPVIYEAFLENNQAFKLPNGRTIFEQSISEEPLSKIDQLSLNYQKNRIIYNLDSLIKTPHRYMTLSDLYARTKTPSFEGAVNQNSLDKLEISLTSQLQQFHHHYQEIIDGMIEIDHLKNPSSAKDPTQQPLADTSEKNQAITEAAQHLFNLMNDTKSLEQKPSSSIAHKNTHGLKISTHDLNGIMQLYLKQIGNEMKKKYPNLYSAFQNNQYSFSTTTGAGNIFHQVLFNARINQNNLPSKAEDLLNTNIKKIMTGISSLRKTTGQYARCYDMRERIKKVHGVPKEDTLVDLDQKLSATINQSKHVITDIMEGLNLIDSLDQQYQEQNTLLSSKQIDDLILSKQIVADLNPPQSIKEKSNKKPSDAPKNTAVNNASFKKSLSNIKANDASPTLKPTLFKR